MSFRLAHVYNESGGGGGAVQARTLLDAWGDHGIDQWGVHASNLGSPESFVTEEPGYPLMYPDRLVDGLREIEPDLVFVHGYSPKLNEQLRQLAEADDFDATWVLRKGMNVLEYWFGAASDGVPRKTTAQITDLDWYDGVICPTNAVADRLSLFYGDECPRLATVPNAIDRDEYVPSSFMKNGWLHVVTASRCAPNNFLLAPLLAVGRIMQQERFPVKLDMFGPENQPLGTIIRTLAEDFEDVEVHGRVDHDDLRPHLEAADVVCVPSFSHQAIPLTAVEGMAAGSVVLGSFYEAYEEPAIVRVPAAHPPAWHEAITDVHADPEDARDYIRQGIERAANYDAETVVTEGYLPVFEDLLAAEPVEADD